MKLYFVKAQYTDGIYKLDDFYVGSNYRVNVNRMQDINLQANDGSTMTTVNTLLPDGSKVNDYSHVLVPEVNKIYEIDRCVYLNDTQTQISLIEDAFIGHYQEVKDKKVRLERTNDETLFEGIHDIEDITVRPDLKTLGTGSTYTGQWVLYFIDPASAKYTPGNSNMYASIYKDKVRGEGGIESYSSAAVQLSFYDITKNYRTEYPELSTSNPLSVNYFNKRVKTGMYDQDAISYYHLGKIKWNPVQFKPMIYVTRDGRDVREQAQELYINKADLRNSVELASDLSSIVLAFPMERNIGAGGIYSIVPYTPEISSALTNGDLLIRGVKIVNESQLFGQQLEVIDNPDWPYSNQVSNDLRVSKKLEYEVTGNNQFSLIEVLTKKDIVAGDIYDNNNPASTEAGAYKGVTKRLRVVMMESFNSELDVRVPQESSIYHYEPFKKHTVTVFGKEYVVAKKNLNTLKIRFASSMNSIEYFGYINNDINQKLFSDSYSTNISWSMDQLDIFNQQNPTYKDQFTANMWRKGLNSFASIGTGAVKGSLKGGAAGAIAGGVVSGLTSAMNVGFDIHAEKLREKGLDLAPDQVFGDGSNISLASQTKYGVFVNTYTSDFEDLMKAKYYLSGFPTTKVTSIEALQDAESRPFGFNTRTKIVKGQLLETVKNKYTTNSINRRLQEGVILI